MLKDVAIFLGEVGKGIAGFIKFWMSVNMSLEAIKERIEDMRRYPDTWDLRLSLAQKQWVEVAILYRHYVLQVCFPSMLISRRSLTPLKIGYLCQFAPPVRPTTTNISKPGHGMRRFLQSF